jgi:transposase
MVKFSELEKLATFQRYLDGHESCAAIANSVGIEKGELQLWIKRYEYYGEGAFVKSYTMYSTQYKLDVLNYMSEHRTSIRETTAIFNLSTTTIIRSWKKLFEVGGINALESKKKGRLIIKKDTKKSTPVEGSIEVLQAELEHLRVENTYLKKLNTLVQNRKNYKAR